MVEPVRSTTRDERERALAAAGLNLFLLSTDDVELDLLTDSGTGAMSQEQWAALMRGDESYAGSRSFERFRNAVREVLGFPFVLPAHQGRGAESIFFGAIIDPGEIVPSNAHFDTTRAHIEVRDGIALDLPVPEALDLSSDAPFKGNMDVGRLQQLLEGADGAHVSIVMLTITYNVGGGQPVSMENIRDVARWHGSTARSSSSTSRASRRTPGSCASGRRASRRSRWPTSPARNSARRTPCS
jgi:tyrosine phenol-lyase